MNTLKRLFYLSKKEKKRQNTHISLIASENFVFPEIEKIAKNYLSNKYAEGYPQNRYYSGCKNIDEIESICIEEAKKLFSCNFANVQSLSGSIANQAIYHALLKPNDLIMAMEMNSGGHLTHGSSVSSTSTFYKFIKYSINEEGKIDYEEIKKLALLHKPKLIVVGYSSYPLKIDFSKFKEICQLINAFLFGDISHLSGLIISEQHQHCFPFCDVVMTTTHKQLRGPRGALILWNNPELTKKINQSVFPGLQGGPNPQAIAGIAVALSKCSEENYKNYCRKVVLNSQILCNELLKKGAQIFCGKTETHLFLLDVKKTYGITGNVAQDLLEKAHICVNKNAIFQDINFSDCSAIRIGTFAATIKLEKEDFITLGNLIHQILISKGDKKVISDAKKEVLKMLKNSKNQNNF